MDTTRYAWPELVADMVSFVEAEYQRLGLTGDAANFLAVMGVMAMATVIDGRKIYLPKPQRMKQEIVRRRVHTEFNGRNRLELAARYGLKNPRTVYAMIGRSKNSGSVGEVNNV